ncbi:MAG TPA: type III pantothenate kinase [Clostridia bacterium]|nr:type III pantothenate kinase [Clostridia bacterium]
MVLTLDVGNTNIKIGLFNEKKLEFSWRISTDWNKTSDEYGLIFRELFSHKNRKLEDVKGIIISSVIPSINYTLEHMCKLYFDINPIMVGPGVKTGINIKYDNPKEVGSDRIVNAVSAFRKYGGPCIVIDFGTATTFGYVTAEGEFLGGCICPGIRISTEALVQKTAKLPKIEFVMPDRIIGRSTVTNMQSGVIYGYVGQVEYIVRRMKEEAGKENVKVIATGGFSRLIAKATDCIDIIDPLLTLEGLMLVYYMNNGEV